MERRHADAVAAAPAEATRLAEEATRVKERVDDDDELDRADEAALIGKQKQEAAVAELAEVREAREQVASSRPSSRASRRGRPRWPR